MTDPLSTSPASSRPERSERRRILIDRPGGYGVLRMAEDSIPPPGPGEVQVEVRACGVNFADVSVRLGLYKAARGMYPICPGLEFSGVAARAGAGVEGFSTGDRVFGASRFGAHTSVINVPAAQLWPLPEAWDFARGAAFPVAYLTAYYGLHGVGHLRSSDRVLVHSAAGGVGTACLHLLGINGNPAVGVVGRSEKVPFAREAGAALVIDKGATDLWKTAEAYSPEGYDLVLDANGASTLRRSYDHLAPGGRLLVYGFSSMFSRSGKKNYLKLFWYFLKTPRFSPFDMTGKNRTVSGFNLIHLFDRVGHFREIMSILLAWDSQGRLPHMPITSFPLEEAKEAHRLMESGRSVGKIVLIVGD